MPREKAFSEMSAAELDAFGAQLAADEAAAPGIAARVTRGESVTDDELDVAGKVAYQYLDALGHSFKAVFSQLSDGAKFVAEMDADERKVNPLIKREIDRNLVELAVRRGVL